MSGGLDETIGFSAAWIVEKLRENDEEFREALGDGRVTSMDAQLLSEGSGFCSRVFRLSLTIAGGRQAAYSAAIKLPTADLLGKLTKQMGGLNDSIEYMHNVECGVYSLLRSLPTTSLPLPRTTFSRPFTPDGQPGVLLMEDLSGRAEPLGFFSSAFVHFELPPAEWRDGFRRNVIGEVMSVRIHERLAAVGEFRDGEIRETIEEMNRIDWPVFSSFALRGLPEKWTYALSRRSPPIAAFIDWQTVFVGSPLFDLALFLVYNCDGEVRRAVQREAVDRFHRRLAAEFARRSAEPPFSRAAAGEMFEVATVYATITWTEVFEFKSRLLFADPNNRENWENGEKLWQKTRMAAADGVELIRKHRIVERFRRVEDER
ncbi:hypothetical protein M3Y99_00650500 [Aphelenchoides fujianensis]|nr:hypothetical protein M3Y99_00650500 [Aphelenchoides fujianensis]